LGSDFLDPVLSFELWQVGATNGAVKAALLCPCRARPLIGKAKGSTAVHV